MTDAKLIRFAAVLTVLAGYAFVFRAGEARIGAMAAGNVRIAEQVRDDERTMASRPTLAADRARLRRRLRSAELAADRSALVARFVRDAAALAVQRRTAITTITAGTATSAGGAAGSAGNAAQTTPRPPLADVAFDDIPLDVTVEGRYADVLATIRALSTGRVLASVDVTSLARKSASSPDATLTASLRVVLQRVVPMNGMEPAGAHRSL